MGIDAKTQTVAMDSAAVSLKPSAIRCFVLSGNTSVNDTQSLVPASGNGLAVRHRDGPCTEHALESLNDSLLLDLQPAS